MDFSTEMRRLREGRGLSQCELATLADLDQASVSDYERGEHVPTFDTALRIFRALKVRRVDLTAGRLVAR